VIEKLELEDVDLTRLKLALGVYDNIRNIVLQILYASFVIEGVFEKSFDPNSVRVSDLGASSHATTFQLAVKSRRRLVEIPSGFTDDFVQYRRVRSYNKESLTEKT
jgi:hypothetical protein